MQNYSTTYAAAITTFAPLVVLLAGRFGFSILESEVVTIVGAAVSFIGFVWQLINRYRQGGITLAGFRR